MLSRHAQIPDRERETKKKPSATKKNFFSFWAHKLNFFPRRSFLLVIRTGNKSLTWWSIQQKKQQHLTPCYTIIILDGDPVEFHVVWCTETTLEALGKLFAADSSALLNCFPTGCSLNRAKHCETSFRSDGNTRDTGAALAKPKDGGKREKEREIFFK